MCSSRKTRSFSPDRASTAFALFLVQSELFVGLSGKSEKLWHFQRHGTCRQLSKAREKYSFLVDLHLVVTLEHITSSTQLHCIA